MPIGPYKDWDACMAGLAGKYPDEETRRKVCGAMENKSENGHALKDIPNPAQMLWLTSFAEAMEKNDPDGAGKIAWASVYRHFEPGTWKPLKQFSLHNIKSIFKSDRIIYGPASVAVVDSDGDLFTEQALANAWNSYKDRGQVLFFHRNIPVGEVIPEYKAPDGTMLQSGVQDKALNVVVRIYKDTEMANEVWAGIERGELRAFSIGGRAIGDSVKVCEDAGCAKSYNRIDQLDLHEISIVPNPANEASYFSVVKSKAGSVPDATNADVKLRQLEKLITDEWAKARNCPTFTESALKIIRGENMTETKTDVNVIIEGMQKDIAALKATMAVGGKAEHVGDCPEGQHMVAGKCVPMEEKTESTENRNMTEEKKTNAGAVGGTEGSMPAEFAALKAEVDKIGASLNDIRGLLEKALKPAVLEQKNEKELPKVEVPNLTEKKGTLTEAQEIPSVIDEAWLNLFEKSSTIMGR